jgi:nucleotide-binding universal stress UspA family protein
MGSRGLSPVLEIVLGSVSDRVLRFAPCAVTIVR